MPEWTGRERARSEDPWIAYGQSKTANALSYGHRRAGIDFQDPNFEARRCTAYVRERPTGAPVSAVGLSTHGFHCTGGNYRPF